MADFYTSDWHFNHGNIIKYSNRPFADTAEMDSHIIRKINEKVKPDDHLYFLGDFLFAQKDKFVFMAECYRERINCKNLTLIWGNHDDKGRKSSVFRELFNGGCHEVLEQGKLVLFHYPIEIWHRAERSYFNLHGHCHDNLADNPNKLRIDVGVDCAKRVLGDYEPFSRHEIDGLMLKKTFVPVDHHGDKNRE